MELTKQQFIENMKVGNWRAWFDHVTSRPEYEGLTVKQAKALAREMHDWQMRFAWDFHIGISGIEARDNQAAATAPATHGRA